MDTTPITIFISSKMVELATERTALYDLLTRLSSEALILKAWAYERDAVASNNSIRDVYLKILEQSGLYIGLFWKAYGAWTMDEFDRATEWHIDRLLFVKADDDQNRDPALQQFLTDVAPVSTGLAPAWFKDEADLCEKVTASVQAWIKEKLTYRPGSSHAVLATDPDDVPHQPRKLIGRDDLLAQIAPAIASGQRVLLKGFGGMGKTALAATAAAEFQKSNPGPVLWLEIGKETPDILFEALARPFNASQVIAKEHGDAKIKAMRALLRQTGVKLLVLDNAWDGPALKTVLDAVPRDLPVIVTSRHAYPLDVRLEVDELTPASAATTLAFYAGNPPGLQSDHTAADLCQLLGYLAFSLEIAGKQIMNDKLYKPDNPALLKGYYERIKDAPYAIEAAGDFADPNRRHFGQLIETSLAALDEQTRNIYYGFGAFFAPQVTPKMLRLLFLEKPEFSSDDLAHIRRDDPQAANMNDEELANALRAYLLRNLDLTLFETALQTLVGRGLLHRVDATVESVTTYRIHNLAQSYLKAQLNDDIPARVLDACLTYTELHSEPSLENFVALLPELDNLMGAATWAYQNGHDLLVEWFAKNLYNESRFLDYQGYYEYATQLLQNAVNAAKRQGNLKGQGAHLGNLGVAYFSLGNYQKAIDFYLQALTIAHHSGDKQGEGSQLCNLGLAHLSLGNHREAINFLTQALAVVGQSDDRRGEGNILGNLGLAYDSVGNYRRAIDFYQHAIAIAQQTGDRRGEGRRLGNLGNTYANLEDYRRAIDFYQHALAIAQQIGDRYSEGNQLGNLGIALSSLGDYQGAIELYQQTLTIAHRSGDKRGESTGFYNLGEAYVSLGDYAKAIEYYLQARAIYAAIGVQHLVEKVDQNIALAQAKLAGGAAAADSPPPAE
ncbi:MAG: tetratricopeptide repeat protein [Anaerolineae bacterium]|nr:tetratricopeptide repeat protein [Anaerolineae bacterium]